MKVLKILGIILLTMLMAACVLLFGLRYITIKQSELVPETTAVPDMMTPAPTSELAVPTAEPTAAPTPTAEPTPVPTPSPTPEPTADPDTPEARALALGLPAPPEIDVNSWEFILANDTHSIGEYAPPELVTLEGQMFDSRIVKAMQDMAADTRSKGLTVCLSSGYRDYGTQAANYRNKCLQYPPDGKDSSGHYIVLPPGTSEHQTGLCCDITYTYVNPKNRDLANTAMYQYMSQHCQEFGFIVRYPEDKEEVTMVMFEPWHFRYVGVEAAAYIMENGLCLEEFLGLYGID